jgi:two-component system, NarL family, sensor kinase
VVTRRAITRHIAVAAVVGVALTALVAIGLWRLAEQDARRGAERVARQVSSAVLMSVASHDYARPGSVDRADLLEHLTPFLRSKMVDRVKIFSLRDGQATVVFSDEPRNEQHTETLRPALDAALRSGQVLVEPVPQDAGHRFENSLSGKRMEVFFGFRDGGGNPAALELYVPVDVAGTTEHGVMVLLPVVLAGFLVVAAALLPVSLALARRTDRERLRHGLTAVELTRRDVAHRLHDGVIPDLAAAGLLIERGADHPDLLGRAHRLVTGEVRQLRTLLTNLVPDGGGSEDPALALRDAVGDDDVSLDISVTGPAGPETVALLHQVATELVRNARRHARASHVAVRLAADGPETLVLTVTDDGIGFDPSAEAPEGHVGLRLVSRFVADHGGTLRITSRPGAGTVASVSVRRTVAAAGRPARPGR